MASDPTAALVTGEPQLTAPRCHWCGRLGAKETTYQLHRTTAVFTRPLCPDCAVHALESTKRARL